MTLITPPPHDEWHESRVRISLPSTPETRLPLTMHVGDHAVKLTASGTVTYQEVVDLIAHRLVDPTRIPGMPVLVDARGVHGAPSAAELRLIAAEMKPLIDTGMGPIGILTDSTFVYGIVRMFSVFAQAMSADVSALRCQEDVELWLVSRRQAA